MDDLIRRFEGEDTRPPGDFPLKPLVASVRDACRAVIHARELGCYHDDLYPGSILVCEEFREVFVADGWAKIRREIGDEGANPDSRVFRCHPEYMDPMHARDGKESHEPQDDVFAFGGILHLILYGTPPNHFTGISDAWKRLKAIASRASEPRKPGKLHPGSRSRGWWEVPSTRDLERICLRALDSDLVRRQQDVEELGRGLDGWLDGH